SREFRSRNRSPIAYDPDAKCPEFLSKVLGHVDEDDRDLLQQYGGQCLLGRNITQKILILDGVGGASKGAFVLICAGIIGQRNCAALRTKYLADRFEIGRFLGKTLLIGADVPSDFMSEEGAQRMKALVGGDIMDAERKSSNKVFPIQGTY